MQIFQNGRIAEKMAGISSYTEKRGSTIPPIAITKKEVYPSTPYAEVTITEAMRDFARTKFQNVEVDRTKDPAKFGSEGGRVMIGFLGESVVMEYYGVDDHDDYEYDTIIGGLKCDVKSISCKFRPPKNYLAVVNTDHRQDSDIYMFVRIRDDYKLAWIVGWIRCKRFFELADSVKKGERYDGILFKKADISVLPISKLESVF